MIDVEKFPKLPSDIEFTKQLVIEECVFCLPGQVSHPFAFSVILQGRHQTISYSNLVYVCMYITYIYGRPQHHVLAFANVLKIKLCWYTTTVG